MAVPVAAEELDQAERLALWGYATKGWEQLVARLPLQALSKGTGLVPYQRGQLALVRARAHIDEVTRMLDEAEIDTEIDRMLGLPKPDARHTSEDRLNAAVTAAQSACVQLRKIATTLPPPAKLQWMLRVLICDTELALARKDYPGVRRVARQALALPDVGELVDRAWIHLALARAAEATKDPKRQESELRAGLKLVEIPIGHEMHAFGLWHAMAEYKIGTGHLDEAWDAIQQMVSVHRAGPSGSFYAWRELKISNLLYRAGQRDEAEMHLKMAIQGQLDADDETEKQRLNGVIAMLADVSAGDYRQSRSRTAYFLLSAPVRQRFGRWPEYRMLVDQYARIAMHTGDLAIVKTLEMLRGPNGELDLAQDARVRVALSLIAARPVTELRALIRGELGIPDATGKGYFGNVLILTAALQRFKAMFGPAADGARETVLDLVLEHTFASRNDLARGELFSYQAEVLADKAAAPDQMASTLQFISVQLKKLEAPRSADDTAALSERERRRARREDCQNRTDKLGRLTACNRYASALMLAGLTVDAIEVLLKEYGQLTSGPVLDIGAVYASSIADELEKALQHTEFAEDRARFFRHDGRLRQVLVGQLCRALLESPSLAQPNGYCAVRQLQTHVSPNLSNTLDAERARLYQWALQANENDVAKTVAAAANPMLAITALRKLAKSALPASEARRLALLVAWEMRAGMHPRNAYTEAEILLELADLYVADENLWLLLACLERALELNLNAGSATPDFLKRVLIQASRHNSADPGLSRLIETIVKVSAHLKAPPGSALLTAIIDVELLAASNAAPAVALDGLERLAQRMKGDVGSLSMQAGSNGLAALCELAVRTSTTPALATRSYRLLRKLLAEQELLHISSGPAQVAVLVAAIDLAQTAGAVEDLATLIDKLARVRSAGNVDSLAADRILGRWNTAQNAARGLAGKVAALSKLSGQDGTDETIRVYTDAILAAHASRQFLQAETLLNRLLEYSVRTVIRGQSTLPGMNPFRKLLSSSIPACTLGPMGLSPAHDLFPGTLEGCGKFMAAWLRNIVLYDAFNQVILHSADFANDHDDNDLEEYFGWESALASLSFSGANIRMGMVVSTLDVARSPQLVLRRDRQEGEAGLLRRLRAFAAGSDDAWRHQAGKLKTDEMAVILHLSRSRMYAWAIRADGVRFSQWEASRAEVRTVMRSVRRQFYLASGTTQLPSLQLEPMTTLYRLVLQPLEPALQGIRQVYVMTNGALALMPYAVLVTGPSQQEQWHPDVGWRPPWLLDRMGVRVMRALGEPATEILPKMVSSPFFLGMGDPVPASWEEGLRARAPCVAALAELGGAADELNQSAVLFGPNAKVLTGRAFTLESVLATKLERYHYLLIASHAVQSDGSGCTNESALVTTIGNVAEPPLLKASAVASRTLSAKLVVLSACETGVDDLDKESRPVGTMATAFLDAGARSVVVSSWPVLSKHAGKLNIALFRSLRDDSDQDPARALRLTMLAMSRSTDPQLSHPIVWGAPFVVGAN